ncbi:MAG: hypothetical protein LAP39_06045 [Acidobacteriia bacterium]|nr:hypothetical protein [Terriglobia bacterium]
MRLSHAIRTGVRISVVLIGALCLCAQEPATQSKDARPNEAPGLPPRQAPTDYQAQTKAGEVTIAADFVGHSVTTAEGPLSTEDYVVVEAGLYGPPESRIQISLDDFSLRINGKKVPLRSQPYGLVLSSLKDPEWAPPESAAAAKSKTSINGSGQADSHSPPPVVHIPIELQRAMAQRTQKASLPLGDRVLPQAGLIFFQYRGKTEHINSLELIYSGSAGKATLTLQP